MEEILPLREERSEDPFEITDPGEEAASDIQVPMPTAAAEATLSSFHQLFAPEEMKASEKETGLKRLKCPASRPLFSHCARPAEPVLEQSPPAAGPKSGSQGETPATGCGRRRRDVQRLECSPMLGRRGEGLLAPTAHLCSPRRAGQLPTLGQWERLARSEQKLQRRSLRG